MSSEWINTTIGEYCPFIYGKGLKKGDRDNSGDIPVYGSNGPVDTHIEGLVNQPGIIIGRKGSVGEIHMSSGPFWPIDTSFYTVKEDLEELWFTYYLLLSVGLDQMNSDSAVPGLNRDRAHSVGIKIPESLEERKKIGRDLRLFDQKIHLNQQTNETLETMAKAIFKSWFVDFDPVRAKIETNSAGRDPNRAAMAAIAGVASFAKAPEDRKDWDEIESTLDQKLASMSETQQRQIIRTAKLFPDELVESEVGEVPKGWEVTEYKSITKVLNGYAFKSKDYLKNSNGIFVLRTKNFGDKGLVERLSDDVYLPDKFINEYSKYVCEPFDLQMVMVGASLGKLGTILPHHLPALRNQNMWCFRAKKETHKFFVDHYLKYSVSKMLSFASGSARSFFRKGDFQKMDVILPPDKLIAKFNEIIEPFYHRISSNESETEALSKSRDTLLPKLISGEVEV